MSTEFSAVLASEEERQAEEEFLRLAREAGLEVPSAAELQATPTPIQKARGFQGEVVQQPARPFRTPVRGGAEEPQPQAQRKRRAAAESVEDDEVIYTNVPMRPIKIVDHVTSLETLIPLRRVPYLQQPYVDRFQNRIVRVREQLQRIEGKSKDELKLIDRLAGHYNDLVEEYLAHLVDRDLNFLADWDIAEIDAFATLVTARHSADRARSAPDAQS